MSTTDVSAESGAKPSYWLWLLTLTVAGLPVAFGLYQVWVFFDEAFPHRYWSRTLPALAAVLLAVAGIAAPIWVITKRRVFGRWPRTRQWQACGMLLLLMSLVYFVPFALLVDAARSSRAIIPYTPTVVLCHSNDPMEGPFYFGVAGGLGTGRGSGKQNEDRYIAEWNAWLEPKHLDRPPGPDPVVHLRAEGPLKHPNKIQVRIETGRTVRFKTLGFLGPAVRYNEEPVSLPITIGPGIHDFTIHTQS